MAAGRETLTNTLHRQLAILAHYVRLAGQNNLSSSHVVAESTMTGLLNRVHGWKLVNANTISQNYPGVDLIDRENHIAVQVTATRTVEKVRHTLEEAGKGGVVYDKLIVMLLTDEQPTPAMKACTVPTYPGPMEVWNLGDVLRIGKELEMGRLTELTEFMEAELGTIEERAKDLPHLEFPPVTALPPTAFVGREEELRKIHSRFADGDKQVVLMGLGGMGKTELAARYGREHPGMVYFVRFDTSFTRTIERMVHGIRPELHPEELKLDSAILRKKVMDLLEKSGSDDLLIIDNADSPTGVLADLLKGEDYEMVKKLPLKLLLTTRSEAPRSIKVRPMPDEPLFQIFRNHEAELTETEMKDLIRAVNGHTLTIDLIARTLNGRGWRKVTAQKMLTALREHSLRDQKYRKIASDYSQSPEQAQIYEHLSVVFDLSGMSDVDKRVMCCACLLPDGGMDSELFGMSLEEDEQDVLDTLLDRGWLEVKNGLLTIHPIIRLVCLTELEPKESDCKAFLEGLWAQFDRKNYRRTQYSQMANLFTIAHDQIGKHHGHWLNWAGIIWTGLHEIQPLHDLYHSRLSALEEALPGDDRELATAYNYYGLALGRLGRYRDGLTYEEKALAIRKAILPENDADLARSYNNVGDAYENLGDYHKALEYKRKAMTIFEAMPSEDNLDRATSYNNVGGTYGNLGEHKRALEYTQKALAILEKTLPTDHPILAASYDNVGCAYGKQGDHKRELEYHQKALTIYEEVLPTDHPDLALSCNNIACTYYELRNLQEAARYMRRAADIISRTDLPKTHPDQVDYPKWADQLEREAEMEQRIKATMQGLGTTPPAFPFGKK